MNRQKSQSVQGKLAKGFALIESLIAFVVLAAGLLALLSFHSVSQKSNAEAKAQSEAVALAEAKLQELESFLQSNDDRLNVGTGSDSVNGVNVQFDRDWEITTVATNLRNASVDVSWDDRDGVTQTVTVSSNINVIDPPQGINELLTLAAVARDKSAGGGDWNTGNPPDEGDGSDDPGDGGDQGSGDGGNDGSSDEPIHTVYDLVISGGITGFQGASLDASISNASADPELIYPAECSTSKQEFTCTMAYNNRSTGWSGTVTLTVNKIFCSTGSSTYVIGYENLTQNVTGLSFLVANKIGDC